MLKSITVKLLLLVVISLYSYCLSLVVRRVKSTVIKVLIFLLALAGLYLSPMFLNYVLPWYLELLKPGTALAIFLVILSSF